MKKTVIVSDFSGARLDGLRAEIVVKIGNRRAKIDATVEEARDLLAKAGIRKVPTR